jgi:hypothetical protein
MDIGDFPRKESPGRDIYHSPASSDEAEREQL